MSINLELKKYIEKNIFPKYEKYYSHGIIHINNVIKNILMLAKYYNLDENMAFVIASYHDLGLKTNREMHEFESGKILNADLELKKYFNIQQIKIMKEAVEDHRGSRKEPPRNIYGKILSDSDRDFNIEILAKRQLETSLKNYPELISFNEHFERCYKYMLTRINNSGKFNLWTDNPILIEKRNKFESDFLNKDFAKTIYLKEWNKISNDGTMEKIINYYEDF